MKAILENLDGIDEALKGEYEQRDGKFYLKLEGIPAGFVDQKELLEANTKIVEFRNKNIALMKENQELQPLKTKYEGIDPEEARTALKKVAALDKKGIKDAEDFDERVKAATEVLIKPLRDQLAMSAAETAEARKRADDSLLHSFISERFLKSGGKANATDYVVGLAKEDFEVKDGKVVPKAGKFSVKHPGDPLTPEEWLTAKVQKEHDYVFTPSNGGGAPPAKPGAPNVPIKSNTKPGQTILKNPTPQQLGEYASEIGSGKMKVEYEKVAAE
jgi:hypothetical protein